MLFLFLLMLAVIVAGLVSIEFGQAARPRPEPIWNDDVERQIARRPPGFGW